MLSNVYDLVLHDYEKKKNKVAIKTNDTIKTYEELVLDIESFSALLQQEGIEPDMRIGIQLMNSYSFVRTFFALQRLGCTVVPINYENWSANVEHIVKDAQIRYIITDRKKVKSSPKVLSDRMLEYDRLLKDIDSSNCLKKERGRSNKISDDVAMILYTSGSTGGGKGVILTHGNVIQGTEIVCDYLKIEDKDCILALLPFSFDYGLNQLLSALYCGASIYMKFPYTFFEIPIILEKEKITGLAGVPSIWIRLLNLSTIECHNYQHLRYITNSGGAIPEFYLSKLQLVFPESSIYLMYGLTECFRCTFLEPSLYQEKKGAIGKAIPGCEVMIVDEENHRCKPNEVGQIIFRGPVVGKGYLNNLEETEKVFRRNPFNKDYSETVVYSGDYGYEDEDGYLYFTGRKDAQLKKSGYRFNLDVLENAVYKCSLVSECVVVSRKNQMQEDDLYLFLKSIENVETDEVERNLYKDVMNQLPSYIRPQKVFYMDEIPKQYNSKYSYVELNKVIDQWMEYERMDR